MQKYKLSRREFCLLSAPILVLAGVLSMPTAKNWLAGFTQNRLYVKNNFHEPLGKLSVWFYGDTRLVFRDVPSGGQQWQLFERHWGDADSNRLLKVEGVSITGKRIGSRELLVVEQDDSLDMGTTFNIIVQPNGGLKLEP